MIELLSTLAIFGVIAATALPRLDKQRENANTAIRNLIADFRVARTNAIAGGVHFAMKRSSASTYEIQRYKLTGTTWGLDVATKTVTLPSNVTFTMSPATLEFNTRGMQITTTSSVTVSVTDTKFGGTRQIIIWPSGQVYGNF